MSTLRHRIALILAFATMIGQGHAQVFIADTSYRNSLNNALPGLVDPAGIMDITHPGIPLLDSLTIVLLHGEGSSVSQTVEVNGLEHLSAVQYLNIQNSTCPTCGSQVSIPACPPNMTELYIQGHNDTIAVGGLPLTMDQVSLYSASVAGRPSFTLLDPPGTIDRFSTGLVHLSWPGIADIGTFTCNAMGSAPGMDVLLPAATIDTLLMYYLNVHDLDLSTVITPYLNMSGLCNVTGDIAWPNGVTNADLYVHNTEMLPAWPATLDTLYFHEGWQCLPPFPDGLRSLQLHYPPQCMPNWPTELESLIISGTPTGQFDVSYCSVLNSDCPGVFPALTGSVMMDLNGNGSVDASEPAVPGANVTIAPGGQMTGCAPDGSWEIGVPPGNHTITAASNYPYLVTIDPASQAASVPELGDVDAGNDFAFAVQPDVQDLRVSLYASPARPGFGNLVYLRCENYGTTPVDAALTLAFDADQSWVGSSVAPATQSGNSASWSFPAMPIGTIQNIVVDLSTATSVPLGTDIAHTLTADPIATDETPGDNTYTHQDSVVGSYDPNDKLLDPKVLSPAQVAQGATPIEYTIRFQNTGTFLAERVVILDTLSEDLQWESMRFIASSHANHWYITDGVLHVVHNDIMLPDSTSDETGSHGFIKFSMLPKTDLMDGATITNIAHIVFDFNEPIITPPAVFSVDVEAGIADRTTGSEFLLLPNPAHDRIQLRSSHMGVLRYRILDVLGAQVQIGTTPAHGWVNVETLPPGPYVMEVEQAEVRTSQRFMKQ